MRRNDWSSKLRPSNATNWLWLLTPILSKMLLRWARPVLRLVQERAQASVKSYSVARRGDRASPFELFAKRRPFRQFRNECSEFLLAHQRHIQKGCWDDLALRQHEPP